MDKLTNNITNNIPKTDLKSSHKTINDVASGKVSDTSVSVDNIVDINTTKKIVSEMAASAPIDADKVATIKEAISSGKYPLDMDKLSDALNAGLQRNEILVFGLLWKINYIRLKNR